MIGQHFCSRKRNINRPPKEVQREQLIGNKSAKPTKFVGGLFSNVEATDVGRLKRKSNKKKGKYYILTYLTTMKLPFLIII